MPWNPVLHTHTPVLTVIEPRGLLARSVSFHRAEITQTPTERVDRTSYDASARVVGRWDARLWAAAEQASVAPCNLSCIHSLSGRPLFSDSADAGWSASLDGEAGQAVSRWNARGHSQRVEYDQLLRAVALFEGDGTVEHCAERFTYGGLGDADGNQCGCLVRHDDPAGSLVNAAFGLSGKPARQVRRFLNGLATADWSAVVSERDDLLESGPGLQTCWTYGAANDAVEQCDALGNIQSFSQSVAGQLKLVQLQQSGQAVQTIVSDIHYNAQGQIESEIAGNGVVTTALYQPQDGRLIQLRAQRDDGHVLQDLNYEYDPVGNVTCLEDGAQSTRFFANQQVDPVSTYRYDTLYQLIEATGRETASTHHGPALPGFQSPPDFSKLTNYRQTYDYDAGGNLLKLSHEGAQNHSLSMVTARQSNHSLPVLNNVPPSEADIAAAFDANGNLRALQPGQTLVWDRRNQLQQVRPVVRESGQDDSEVYVYDGKGQRIRKVTTTLARSVTHTAEVRYLPSLEVRTNTATGETLNVITLQAGRNSVRVLHWRQGKPENIANDQIRYSLSDHLGSCALELDQQAQLISQESYYPFGGTSRWAGRSEVVARYKTVRYSGKERDATGLYYYGLRYYAPWLMRWINPDPAGDVDGLNLFCMVSNSPLNHVDYDGLMQQPPPVPSRPQSTLGRSRPAPVVVQAVASVPVMPVRERSPAAALPPAPEKLPVPHERLALETGEFQFEKLKEVSSTYETWIIALAPEIWAVSKAFSSMMVISEIDKVKQRVGASNEVLAYEFSDRLKLDLVPATTMRPGTDREVVSRYVPSSETPVDFDRRKSPLYVFDFLLNTRDRLDDGRHGNLMFDKAGRPYAIDHELILEPGYNAIAPSTISTEQVQLFSANPDTRELLQSTDWGAFFETHVPSELERRAISKSEFLERIAFIQQKITR
jgi:insecticidal toxin complex protein TccC